LSIDREEDREEKGYRTEGRLVKWDGRRDAERGEENNAEQTRGRRRKAR
jgi:hypothetical protein